MLKAKIRHTWNTITTWIDQTSAFKLSFYLILICLALFWFSPKEVIGGDSPGIAYLPASIIRHRTLKLDPYVNQDPLFDLDRGPHWVVTGRNGYFSKFSPVPSILSIPVYAGMFLFQGVPEENTGQIVLEYFVFSRYVALLIMTSAVIIIFHVMREIGSQRKAFLFSMVYAFATFAWHAASSTLAAQSSGELFLAMSMLYLLRAHRRPMRFHLHLFVSGLCMGIAVAARLHLAFIAVLFLVYVLLFTSGKLKQWMWYVVGALPVAVLLAIYNTWAFGAPWLTGYGIEANQGWSTPILSGLSGILFSPSHGLLVYSPILLLALGVSVIILVRIRSLKEVYPDKYRFFVVVAIGTISYLLLMSKWWWWFGGVAYNQRMLEEVHPLLLMMLAAGFVMYKENHWYSYAVGLTGLLGFMMNVVSLTFQNQHLAVIEKHRPELIWSFRDMEWLFYLREHGLPDFVWQMVVSLGSLLVVWMAVNLVYGLMMYLLRTRTIRSDSA